MLRVQLLVAFPAEISSPGPAGARGLVGWGASWRDPDATPATPAMGMGQPIAIKALLRARHHDSSGLQSSCGDDCLENIP